MTNQASIKLVLGVGLEATHLLPNIQPTSVVQTPCTPWLITFFHIRRLVFSPWRPWSILSLLVCSLPSKYWYDASWLPCNLERPGSFLDLWPEDPLAQIQCLVSYIHIYLKDPGFSVWIQYILISCTFTVIVLGSEWSSGRRITFEVSLRRLRWLKVTKGKCFKCFGSALVLPGARGVCSAGANALSEIRGQPSRRKTSNLSQCWRTLTQQPLWFLWLSCYWTSA